MKHEFDPKRRAKLFLSCGQRADLDELRFGQAVRDSIDYRKGGLGYDVFFAKGEQEPHPVVQVIFRELRDSDYYVFIDFKRERLVWGLGGDSSPSAENAQSGKELFRGSLFTHQEFAIACYLGLPFAAFREGKEEKIEALGGIIGSVLGNLEHFEKTSPESLAARVSDFIQKRGWPISSRGRLDLRFAGDIGRRDNDPKEGWISYYHLNIVNLHARRAATNCFAYIDSIIDQRTGERVDKGYTCELKWEGTKLQGIRIGPGSSRGIDACIVYHRNPSYLMFSPETDAENHKTRAEIDQPLIVTYVVCCDEFQEAKQSFFIKLKADGSVEFMPSVDETASFQ